MYRVDELIQTRALIVGQRPRARVAAAGVNAHLLCGRHFVGYGLTSMRKREKYSAQV